MYAYFTAGHRLFPRYYVESFLGLALLRSELPSWGRRQRWEKKALRFLRRAGAGTLLNGDPDCAPLHLLETGELYRKKAAELALVTLRAKKIPPEKAVVGLLGNQWTRDMENTVQTLATQVRSVSLCLPRSEEITWELQQTFGLPVFQGDGDITLCFSGAEPAPGRLLLGAPRPQVEGISFRWKEGALPEDAPADALLTVLVENGKIAWSDIAADAQLLLPPP